MNLSADPANATDLRGRLYTALRGNARPVFVFGESMISGANLWSGSRMWVRAYREAGLQAGSRVLLSLAPSQNMLWALIGALCEGVTLAIAPEPGEEEALAALEAELDVSLSISSMQRCQPAAHRARCANPHDLPDMSSLRSRKTRLPPSPTARLLLKSSGTTDDAGGTWVALSSENVLSVVDSHHARIDFRGETVLSVLPWHHAFGLVLELLPALLFQAEVVRDLAGGRDSDHLLQLLCSRDFTRLSGVPVLFERLFAAGDRGGAAFANLQGIVGGAPVSGRLAAELKHTRLRAGYGQTQAGPGITLGEPGDWSAGYLGTPTGCTVRLAADGELLYRGANLSPGDWDPQAGVVLPPLQDGFRASGDVVRQAGERLYFAARKSYVVKLPNGRWLHPQAVEAQLRERYMLAGHCLVLSNPSNGRLRLICSEPIAHDQLSEALRNGTLGTPVDRFIEGVELIAARALPVLPKGDVQRTRLHQQIFASESG